MVEETQTSAAADTEQMPRDTMVPGEISLAMGAARPEFAHAFGRRIRSGDVVLEPRLVAGLAHAVGQLLEALNEKNERVSLLEEGADEVRQVLEEHETHAARLAQAVKAARVTLGKLEKEW